MQKTEPREERIKKLLLPCADDIIAGIISYLPETFSADYRTIHTAFSTLKQEEDYRDILKDFEFVGVSPYPFSPLLERVLHRLQEDRLLAARNPDYRVYLLSEKSRGAIQERILPKFSDVEKGKLKELAKKLEETLVE